MANSDKKLKLIHRRIHSGNEAKKETNESGSSKFLYSMVMNHRMMMIGQSYKKEDDEK